MRLIAELTIRIRLVRVVFVGLIMGFTGCTAPEIKFKQQADNNGFKQQIIQGTTFKHVVYSNVLASHNEVLHVYLDGDGSAWIKGRWISPNPTPRNTLMLRLMKQDKVASIYLGRPCYHGLSDSDGCTSKLWTSHRYSQEVIHSLVVALNELNRRYKPRQTVIIGYSGGGTLAMLLAEHISTINGVVTIAANLDIDSWTDFHGHVPLTGSLNPAHLKPLRKNLFQLHLAGGRDKNIPIDQIRSFTERQFSSRLIEFDVYDHYCCWEEIWPSVLELIDRYGK